MRKTVTLFPFLVLTASIIISVMPVSVTSAENAWGFNQLVYGDWPMFRANPSHSGAGRGGTDNSVITPTLLWKYTVPIPKATILPENGVKSTPAVVDGVVYVGSDNSLVYALNASDGVQLWNFTTTRSFGTVESSPAVANGVVYVGSFDGRIYALNATN